MKRVLAASYPVDILIAGDPADARRVADRESAQ